jgi:hypothetical protein
MALKNPPSLWEEIQWIYKQNNKDKSVNFQSYIENVKKKTGAQSGNNTRVHYKKI